MPSLSTRHDSVLEVEYFIHIFTYLGLFTTSGHLSLMYAMKTAHFVVTDGLVFVGCVGESIHKAAIC